MKTYTIKSKSGIIYRKNVPFDDLEEEIEKIANDENCYCQNENSHEYIDTYDDIVEILDK